MKLKGFKEFKDGDEPGWLSFSTETEQMAIEMQYSTL
jgi:hypothetical protein